MKTITITEEQVKQYKLPAKAVGDWSIVENGDGYGLLHRLKKDGTLGSDRPNNKIKIELEVLNKLSASDTKAITGKTENGDTVVIAKTKHIDNEPKGTLTTTESKNYNWTTNLQILYNRSIGVNYISGSLGLNTTEDITSTTVVSYKGFPSGNLSSVMYAQEVNGKPTQTDNHTRLVGAFARLNYSYDDIYLFDGSVRFDGSSEFGSDKKFAPFWSAGVGLNIHNYKLLKDSEVLTQLKITGTYGQTGKLNFEPYAAKDIYEVFY